MFSRYLIFCLDFFDRVAKQLDLNDKINYKIFDVTAWLTNNCITHIAKYLEKYLKLGQFRDYNMRIIFIEKLCTKWARRN